MTISTDYLVDLLMASVDFAQLPEQALNDLALALEIESVPGGAKVITEGAEADFLFILVSGRLRVSREDKQGKLLLYNEVLPGDCVGETGMILEQPRTSDILAMRDSVIAKLDRHNFEVLIKKYPLEFNKIFSNAIYRHLRHQRRISHRRRAQSFLVIPISEQPVPSEFVENIEASFSQYGRTKTLYTSEFRFSDTEQVDNIDLDVEESKNDNLIYVANGTDLNHIKQLLHHADQVIFVADGHQSPALTEIESQLSTETSFELLRKHLVLFYNNNETECASRTDWHEPRKVERIYPLHRSVNEDYQRLVRFLTGNAVGVVFGGGGARGFAHLGVIRAFQEHNIPIDIIGGNSMGALIGACYAIGTPLHEIHTRILGHAKKGMKLSFPLISLMSNKNLESAFKEELGNVKIENLWVPYFSAACNLTNAETTVLDHGYLWRAVLASNSPAGLFPPVVDQGELLVDGAILENVPVQAMRMRLGTELERRRGNGKIIAIDVDLKDKLEVNKEIKSLSNWKKFKSHFSSKRDTLPGMVDILMQVAHVGGLTKRFSTKRSSDFYLEPPLKEFSITDYKKADAIIEAGYVYAVEKIKEWNWQN